MLAATLTFLRGGSGGGLFGLLIDPVGHSDKYVNAAKLVGKISKSVMQLISIHF